MRLSPVYLPSADGFENRLPPASYEYSMMEVLNLKRVAKIILIGICFGLILLLFKISFGIDDTTFMHGYWIVAIAIVLGAVLINLCYNLIYLNKVKKIAKLLSEEKSQEYIAGIENLLKTAKGKTLRNILELNLAAGYIETKQFDIAIPMLEKLSLERLSSSSVNVVHKINLCLSYFETTQHEKAITICNENQELFQQYRHHKIYGGNIAILDIIAAIINEQYNQAEELLDTAKKMYDDARLQKSFQEILDILNKAKIENH